VIVRIITYERSTLVNDEKYWVAHHQSVDVRVQQIVQPDRGRIELRHT
jgi:hypothetical protein